MSNQNDDRDSLNFSPDPAWDYYIEWHKLLRAKAQLDKLIEFMSKLENGTEETQEILMQDVSKIINTLEDI